MALPGECLVRLNTTMLYDGQNCQNSYFARFKPTSTVSNFFDACTVVNDEWRINVWPNIKVMLSSQVQLIGVVAQTVFPNNAAIVPQFFTTDFGSVAGDALPSNTAAVLSLYSQYPGRSTHGRLTWAGVPESSTTLSRLNATGLFALKNLGDTLIGRYGQAGSSIHFWFGVFSRKYGTHISPGPPPFTVYDPQFHYPFARYRANDVIGTQRHRMQHRGI